MTSHLVLDPLARILRNNKSRATPKRSKSRTLVLLDWFKGHQGKINNNSWLKYMVSSGDFPNTTSPVIIPCHCQDSFRCDDSGHLLQHLRRKAVDAYISDSYTYSVHMYIPTYIHTYACVLHTLHTRIYNII